MRILLVEDDMSIGSAVSDHISAHGHALDWASTLSQARELTEVARFDAILLDLRLPDGDGNIFLKELRAKRDGTPVIMNLSDMDDADAKRLVDFAAGLVFGLHGSIERVTSKVFLLSPSHVEVSAEEGASGAPARGLFNQS